jgi:hypothetical protein
VRVWDVDAATLHRSYRDRSERWTHRRVRVRLPAHSYSVAPGAVVWHAGADSDPPAVRFLCDRPPADSANPVELTGVCRGCARPGGPVTVADCSAAP